MRMQSDHANWFVGVVEDRLDPMQQGRVRVRVAGVHPFSRIQGDVSGISVEELPWMSCLFPSTSANTSGVGGQLTGLLNGSSVFGFWLDRYKTNGIVFGPYSGNQINFPNPEEGFSDPLGQYPNQQFDINGLNAGGAYGDSSGANAMQNGNASTGVNLDGKEAPGEDNNPALSIEKMLEADELVMNTVYWVDGYPHIGIGHLIIYRRTRDSNLISSILSKQVGRPVGNSIRADEVSRLFKQDLDKVHSEIRKSRVIAPVYMKLNRSRQMALENMAFQMGTGGLAKFTGMLRFMGEGKWLEASLAAKTSLWARQTPGRANRVAMIIKNGNLASYGVMPPKLVGKMALRSTTSSFIQTYNGFDPDDPNDNEIEPDYDKIPILDSAPEDLSIPYVPEDTGVLFQEPNSTYRGAYPYVKAHVSEGGHLTEFDDTPGQERYRLMHPSGSYTEKAADGRVTDKSMGDRYFLTIGGRNDLVEGELKANIGGKETTINFADVERTIDGVKTEKITGTSTLNIDGDNVINVKGNETKKITGKGTIEVGAGIKIIVNGNADITVNGNCDSKVTGNYSLNVGGTYKVVSGAVTWQTTRFDVV